MKNIKVNMAEFVIGKEDEVLEATGVGSCIIVCLYDRIKKIGALAHIMLPSSEGDTLNPFRFVNTALPLVFMDLEKIGIDKKNLEAHVIGGASMFTNVEDHLKLGEKNSRAVEEILSNYGIPIITRDIGGNTGRRVKFFLNSGEIQIHFT